jgi:hypothetical protein
LLISLCTTDLVRTDREFGSVADHPGSQLTHPTTAGMIERSLYEMNSAGSPLGLLGLKPQGPRPCPVLKRGPYRRSRHGRWGPQILFSKLSPRAPAPMIRHWRLTYSMTNFLLTQLFLLAILSMPDKIRMPNMLSANFESNRSKSL